MCVERNETNVVERINKGDKKMNDYFTGDDRIEVQTYFKDHDTRDGRTIPNKKKNQKKVEFVVEYRK